MRAQTAKKAGAIDCTARRASSLDNPFRDGVGKIKPVAMELSLRILDRGRAVVNERDRIPCDALGAAVPRRWRTRNRGARTDASRSRLRRCRQCGRWRPPGGLPVRALARRAGQGPERVDRRSRRVDPRRGRGESEAQIHVALFTQWVDTYAGDETELADFYRKRFRPEFLPAFQPRVATRPRTSPPRTRSPSARSLQLEFRRRRAPTSWALSGETVAVRRGRG